MDGSQKETAKKHFFINICHRVLQEGRARGCPEDAAVCSVGEWGALAGTPRAALLEGRAAIQFAVSWEASLSFISAFALWVQHIKDAKRNTPKRQQQQ